jgi:hypothetical protein
MTCKACKFDHPVMQGCKAAARIRANNATVDKNKNVASMKTATASPASVVAFEHPNVYPNPVELGWDKIKRAKTSTERSREHRARKAA